MMVRPLWFSFFESFPLRGIFGKVFCQTFEAKLHTVGMRFCAFEHVPKFPVIDSDQFSGRARTDPRFIKQGPEVGWIGVVMFWCVWLH